MALCVVRRAVILPAPNGPADLRAYLLDPALRDAWQVPTMRYHDHNGAPGEPDWYAIIRPALPRRLPVPTLHYTLVAQTPHRLTFAYRGLMRGTEMWEFAAAGSGHATLIYSGTVEPRPALTALFWRTLGRVVWEFDVWYGFRRLRRLAVARTAEK